MLQCTSMAARPGDLRENKKSRIAQILENCS
ncbi:hypothetical protein SAMN05444141_103168 [Pseudovibrio denitrificans]|uniref:Uncharacterized protein n=1 Tax=Pseudovibrio denitrificans TaxID=258256 RepID=A0A1I7AKV8_9HYPH|nr:hypothetical protein SAMN05444141_103168 [Pseudovibrio denitrificans]